jgi:uncharacterized Zn finger protein
MPLRKTFGGTNMKTLATVLGQLTFDDLDHWAGEKIHTRGRSYSKRVDGLHRTPENELVAWVTGTRRYATLVRLDDQGDHDWFCTCPYVEGPCKHAVAVILAAAQQIQQHHDIPLLDQDDNLAQHLFSGRDNQDPETEATDPDPPTTTNKVKRPGTTRIHKLLADKSREELVALVVALAKEHPLIERQLQEAEQLRLGQIEPLIRSLRREIRKLTDEPAWRNRWNNEGSVPDYSHVQQQFRSLLGAGHADQLLDLGDELWRLGTDQVEQSDDEGETMAALSDCMEIVLQAVPRSSLPRTEQLLWVIDRVLADEFSLLEGGEEMLADPVYTITDWQGVAAVLEQRLTGLDVGRTAHFADTYRRTRLINWLIKAYERGGTTDKIIPLLAGEADICGKYEQLVERLLAAGEREQARQWCIRGFDRTRKESPGIAACLQKRLREMAAAEKRDDLVAAYRAQDFFCRPSLDSYRELRKAAEKIGVWPSVRELALKYVETGQRPDLPGKGSAHMAWLLPEPEVTFSVDREGIPCSFPDRITLIDIAIFEKRFDEVVQLYQALKKSSRTGGMVGDRVARAVVKTHPEVALRIWREMVDRLIAEVKPKAYVEAGGYLRLMRKVYEAGERQAEWQALLAELRRTHKAKRRLLEILDSLSGISKKIVG